MEIVATVRKSAEYIFVLVFCKTDDTPASEYTNGSESRFWCNQEQLLKKPSTRKWKYRI